MLHDVAGVRRVDELAAADVDADVVVIRVEEHEIAGRELARLMCVPEFHCAPVKCPRPIPTDEYASMVRPEQSTPPWLAPPHTYGTPRYDIAVATTRAPIEPFAGGAGMSTDVCRRRHRRRLSRHRRRAGAAARAGPPPPPEPPMPGSAASAAALAAPAGAEPRLGLAGQLRLERLLLLLELRDLALEARLEALRLRHAVLDRGLAWPPSPPSAPRRGLGLLERFSRLLRSLREARSSTITVFSWRRAASARRPSRACLERVRRQHRRHRVGVAGAVRDHELRARSRCPRLMFAFVAAIWCSLSSICAWTPSSSALAWLYASIAGSSCSPSTSIFACAASAAPACWESRPSAPRATSGHRGAEGDHWRR